jgi:hypothetical protein
MCGNYRLVFKKNKKNRRQVVGDSIEAKRQGFLKPYILSNCKFIGSNKYFARYKFCGKNRPKGL